MSIDPLTRVYSTNCSTSKEMFSFCKYIKPHSVEGYSDLKKIQVYLNSAFLNTYSYKAALQKMQVSILQRRSILLSVRGDCQSTVHANNVHLKVQ